MLHFHMNKKIFSFLNLKVKVGVDFAVREKTKCTAAAPNNNIPDPTHSS